jgi:hypothetical protein
MNTYREAIHHARSGGTAYCGAKQVRFLTFAEAEPIILEQTPSRRVLHDEKGVVEKDGQTVVETFADPKIRLSKFGLYDVGQQPPVKFQPTDEDMYVYENGEPKLDDDGHKILRIDWRTTEAPPEPIAPEAVDEALTETLPPTEEVPPETQDNTGIPLHDDIHDD